MRMVVGSDEDWEPGELWAYARAMICPVLTRRIALPEEDEDEEGFAESLEERLHLGRGEEAGGERRGEAMGEIEGHGGGREEGELQASAGREVESSRQREPWGGGMRGQGGAGRAVGAGQGQQRDAAAPAHGIPGLDANAGSQPVRVLGKAIPGEPWALA